MVGGSGGGGGGGRWARAALGAAEAGWGGSLVAFGVVGVVGVVRPSLCAAGPAQVSFPAIFLYHVRQLDDVLALLVLLARLERQLIFPSERGLAALAVDVGDGMEAGEKHALLRRAAPDVNYRIEKVCAPLASLERL